MEQMQKLRIFLLLIQISVLTYGCDNAPSVTGNDHSHDQDHTYYSIEDALKDSLGANFLFLSNVDSISPDIGKLRHLRWLSVRNSTFSNLPESISNLQFLSAVYFNDCSFVNIPPQIFSVRGVQQLEITSSRISSIPAEFKIWKLWYLDLSDNSLRRFDSSSVDLSNMGLLRLNNNKLTDFPYTKEIAPRLRYLWLKGNQLPDTVKARLKTEFSDINIYLDD